MAATAKAPAWAAAMEVATALNRLAEVLRAQAKQAALEQI